MKSATKVSLKLRQGFWLVLSTGLVIAALGLAKPALADPYYHRGYNRGYYHQPSRYYHSYHRVYRPYYYQPRVVYYEPPPVVYYEPAPSPFLSFIFPLNFR